MKPHDFNKAKAYMDELRPVQEMLANIKLSKPTVIVSWGTSSLTLNGFNSPDGNKKLIEAVVIELEALEKHILEQLDKI